MTSLPRAPAGIATWSVPSDEATIPPVVPMTAEVISMFVFCSDPEPHPRAVTANKPHTLDLMNPRIEPPQQSELPYCIGGRYRFSSLRFQVSEEAGMTQTVSELTIGSTTDVGLHSVRGARRR